MRAPPGSSSFSQGLFRFLDILLFVEATIYQMDEENEALCEQLAGSGGGGDVLQHTFAGACGSRA
jgi:hypothetical protein